jgi:hypothetical protein
VASFIYKKDYATSRSERFWIKKYIFLGNEDSTGLGAAYKFMRGKIYGVFVC